MHLLPLAALLTLSGNLDRALLTRSGQVLENLASAGHRTVGVLPFRIRKGPGAASADAAPLGVGLASRLENALIVVQASEKASIRVLRGCGDGQAMAKRFQTNYEAAWGETKMKPDALLTGEVALLADRRNVQVLIEMIEPTGGPIKVAAFRVECDLALLRDLGFSFVLPVGTKPADAVATALKQLKGDEKPASLVALDVEYDGTKQPGTRIAAPKSAQKVALYLARQTAEPEKLGAVLRVGGRSLFMEDDADPADCKRWILSGRGKGVRQDFRGFYHKTEKGELMLRPFKIGEARTGWIELDLYAPLAGKEPARVSTRALATARGKTLKELQARLLRANGLTASMLTAKRGGLSIADIEPGPGPNNEKASWQHLGGITIKQGP